MAQRWVKIGVRHFRPREFSGVSKNDQDFCPFYLFRCFHRHHHRSRRGFEPSPGHGVGDQDRSGPRARPGLGALDHNGDGVSPFQVPWERGDDRRHDVRSGQEGRVRIRPGRRVTGEATQVAYEALLRAFCTQEHPLTLLPHPPRSQDTRGNLFRI